MKSRVAKRLMAIWTMVTVVSVLLTACDSFLLAAGPTPVPKSTEPIKIALIGPQTGTNAVLGAWQKKGYELVIDEKNATGGIQGRKITVLVEDDEADPTKAVNLAQKVITQDKVVAAMACPNSTPTLAVVPIFAQNKVPHLTPALNVDITKKGSKYVFRTAPAGAAYEDTLVDFLVAQGYQKYAIISDNSAFGKGEGDYQEAALFVWRPQSLTTTYGTEDKDFAAQLTKIMQTDAQVLLIAGSEIAAGLITKQSRQLGFKGVIAGGTAIGTPTFSQTAGDAAEGVIFTSPYITADVSEVAKTWAAKYKARYGEDLESHGAQAIDGANILIMALEKAYPNISPETVATELRKICGYEGVQGEFCYDENGEGIKKVQVGIHMGGKLTPYTGK
jgi:branched-chain amino acid transport system substrate-binding protein